MPVDTLQPADSLSPQELADRRRAVVAALARGADEDTPTMNDSFFTAESIAAERAALVEAEEATREPKTDEGVVLTAAPKAQDRGFLSRIFS